MRGKKNEEKKKNPKKSLCGSAVQNIIKFIILTTKNKKRCVYVCV